MSRNDCGPRALAECLRVLGLPARPVPPPDTPRAVAGTTPWGLVRRARAVGLDARLEWSWRARAFTLEPGELGIALVSLGPSRGLHRAHWLVVRPGEAPEVAGRPFARAWRGFWLPGYRHCVVRVRRERRDA